MVQWHPTILTKLALIPQRLINSYNVDIASRGGQKTMYADDDFVIRLVGCELDKDRNCEREMEPHYRKWKQLVPK